MTVFEKPVSVDGDPLTPHLLDILSTPESQGLIVAGGFGIRLKQAAFRDLIDRRRTLIGEVPFARLTSDLDLFLEMDLWLEPERGKAMRSMLDSLGYTVVPGNAIWKFSKPLGPETSGQVVTVDLMARYPTGASGHDPRIIDGSELRDGWRWPIPYRRQ